MPSISSTVSRFSSLEDHPESRGLGEKGGRFVSRTVHIDPQLNSWKNVAAGSVVPLGIAGAAAFATYVTTYERVAMTAWIAVAVVGSASVIAAACSSRHRSVEIGRTKGGKRVELSHEEDGAADWQESGTNRNSTFGSPTDQ